MATTDYEDLELPSRLEQVEQAFGLRVAQVTDTDQSLRLRVWVLIVVIGVCCLFAPLPFNVIGVASTLALAMSAPVRRRG